MMIPYYELYMRMYHILSKGVSNSDAMSWVPSLER